MLAPRTAYQYSQHSDDEGTYTDYAGENPPYGAMIYFYQKSPAKNPPVIRILDASGKALRTASGNRTTFSGKQEPWVTNKQGINRFVWDFQADGPVKWYGAAKPQYQGPDEGPYLPPGRYTVLMTVGGRTYREPFTVKPDPRSHFTQGVYVRSYTFAKKYFNEFSTVDTMLNNLDDAKKQLNAAAANQKAKADAALQGQITAALMQRDAVFHVLTADYHNDEDSIQRPGALREDMQGLSFFGQGVVTPAVAAYGARIDVALRSAVGRYNAFAQSLRSLNTALQQAGLKPITAAPPVSAGI